jgi:hypothetical protein
MQQIAKSSHEYEQSSNQDALVTEKDRAARHCPSFSRILFADEICDCSEHAHSANLNK